MITSHDVDSLQDLAHDLEKLIQFGYKISTNPNMTHAEQISNETVQFILDSLSSVKSSSDSLSVKNERLKDLIATRSMDNAQYKELSNEIDQLVQQLDANRGIMSHEINEDRQIENLVGNILTSITRLNAKI